MWCVNPIEATEVLSEPSNSLLGQMRAHKRMCQAHNISNVQYLARSPSFNTGPSHAWPFLHMHDSCMH
jgi:hypothetical protein